MNKLCHFPGLSRQQGTPCEPVWPGVGQQDLFLLMNLGLFCKKLRQISADLFKTIL